MVVTYDDGWFQKLYDHKHSLAYQLYSPAYHKAIENGCIYVCLTGLDVDMMVRTIGRVNYTSMQKMAALLYQMAQASEKVIVTSPAGTNIKMLVDKKGDPFWEAPPSKGGFPQILGGQSGYMIQRESVEGVLVFDGAIWPPSELGLLQSPIRLTIESGYVKQIDGGLEATIFSRWLDSFNHPEAYLIDHACFGFNPGVTRPSGRILEDERVFGCSNTVLARRS